MNIRVGINGFGRIGRLVMRAFMENRAAYPEIALVAINDIGDPEVNAFLLQHDSVHGPCPQEVRYQNSSLQIEGAEVQMLSAKDPAALPWRDLQVDIVLECSGHFTAKEKSLPHLQAGAKRVLISAPADGVDFTVAYGVNHQQIKADHVVISNSSCTTNCLAPVAHVLHNAVGIECGYMTTVHSFTSDQRLVDSWHSDVRRARAASVSMIPTSTGAARAIGKIIPELNGLLDGTAIRVPSPNVSLIDFKFIAKRPINVQEINDFMQETAQGELKGVLQVTDLPLVSIDFNHNPHSSIFDLTQTQVVGERLGRILSWYDNEWGFANRMLDVARIMGKQLCA
jgi:glyceraldehyde 3-phosphate dehydrogenase